MQLTVDAPFWALFPAARIGTLVVHGVNNTGTNAAASAMLNAQIEATAAALAGADMATHPAIAPWRAAYRSFGVKPAQFRSSIESLLRSAQSGRLRSISPLVDLYNTVSLRYQLPCGGEDLATIVGNIVLTRAVGGEAFRTIGATEDDPPVLGEVMYRDDAGAICRCFNWREADRTKLTEATTDAILVIEALGDHDPAQLNAALAELAALVTAHCGGSASIAVATKDAPVVSVQ